MVNQRLLPDFQVANGDGIEKPFPEYLADFNLLAIRRTPAPSHGPATKLLRRLLAKHCGAAGVSVRGFDIRTPDEPCQTCHGPRIVFMEPDLATICDSDGSILQKFGVAGYDRFFVVRSDSQMIDVGSIEEISRWGLPLDRNATHSQYGIARAPPMRRHTGRSDTAA